MQDLAFPTLTTSNRKTRKNFIEVEVKYENINKIKDQTLTLILKYYKIRWTPQSVPNLDKGAVKPSAHCT